MGGVKLVNTDEPDPRVDLEWQVYTSTSGAIP